MIMLSSQLHKTWQFVDEGVQKWRKFEDQMAEINTMLDDTEKKHLVPMREAIEDLAVKWGKSANDMADAMYQTLSASVDAGRAIEFLGVASKVATAGLSTVERAVDVLTTILNAYGMTVSEADRVSDVLFKTVKEGKLRFDDLASALGFVVPIAAQMGVTIEELTTALATLTKQGINANMAARGLRVVFNNILRPTEEATDAAQEYGIMLDGLHFSVVGLSGFIDELNEGLGENRLALAEMFPNVRALSAILALTAQEGDIFGETFVEVMDKSAGAASKAALEIVESGGFFAKAVAQVREQTQKDIGEKVTGFWEDASVAALKFGQGLMGVARAAQGVLTFGTMYKDAAGGMQYHTREILKLNQVEGDVKETQRELTEEFRRAIDAYVDNASFIEMNTAALSEYIIADDVLLNQTGRTNEELEAAAITIHNFTETWDQATDITNQGASALAEWEATELLLNKALEDLDVLIPQITEKLANLRIIRDIENDMYKASMALRDVAVAGSYTDGNISSLVFTLKEYSRQLEDMRSAQRGFTREQKLLNIEMLELTMGTSARGQRGRSYKRQVEEFKKQQDELRLKTMKGDIELSDFKENYYDKANEAYNKYILEQQVMIRELAGARDEEITNLEFQLDSMIFKQETYNSDLIIVLENEENIRAQHYANLIAMKEAYEAGNIPVPPGLSSQIAAVSSPRGGYQYNDFDRWWAEQHGLTLQHGTSYVPQTGLALLHKGEAVIPANQNTNGGGMGGSVHVDPMTINVNIYDNADIPHLVQKIELALQSGLLSGLTTGYR